VKTRSHVGKAQRGEEFTFEINAVAQQIEVEGRKLRGFLPLTERKPTATVKQQGSGTLCRLAQQKFTDALHSRHGVVRSRKGKLNFNGHGGELGSFCPTSTRRSILWTAALQFRCTSM